jgi:hypothetical protein
MVLSIMRSCEELRLPISQDISTVTEECSFVPDLMEDIINFIPSWVQRITPLKLCEMKYHYTIKNGPNGHALLSSDSDISAVMNDPKLFGAIQVVQDKLNDSRPMNTFINTDVGIHSKLTQFPEKAGKTRTIAVIDYYSQRCLKPLHKGVMNILASLVSDGTYSHQNVGKFAQQKTKEKSYIFCADLTAFTDRFPAQIQRVLLDELVKDSDLSQAFWTLLAERTFTVAWSGEQVTYQCGQPMGAYASWPLCSLAHHLLVEYSANLAGIKSSKSSYRLIGDDVIITDRKIAQNYVKIIQSLGIEINYSKTVESTDSSDYSGAEVAKQLYLNGICLSPITPGFVRDLRNPYMLNTCMSILSDRYDFFSTEHPSMLIDLFYPVSKHKTNRKKSWLLSSNPISGVIMPGMPGYDELSPWTEKDLRTIEDDYFVIVGDLLSDKALKYVEQSFERMFNRADHGQSGTQILPSCIDYVSQDINNELTNMLEQIDQLSMEDLLTEVVARFDYVPDPNAPYMTRRETRQRRHSSLIESLYDYDESSELWKLGW